MNKPARTRQPKERREADILQAARKVFSEKGYGATSVLEIATLAQVAEGTVYKYFPSKEALLARVLQDFYEEIIKRTRDRLRGVNHFKDRLRIIALCHIEVKAYDEGMARLVVEELRPLNTNQHSSLHLLARRYVAILDEVLTDGVNSGVLRKDLPIKITRDMIFGGLEHRLWNGSFQSLTDADYEALVEDMLGVILPGILMGPLLNSEANLSARNTELNRELTEHIEKLGEMISALGSKR